jgi:hypothetical protein
MKMITALFAAAFMAAMPVSAAETPFPHAKPLRLAPVKIQVQRGYLGYQDTLEKNHETICEFGGEIPVYAPADSTKIARLYGNLHCDTLQNGEKVRIQVSGAVYFDEAKGDTPAKKSLRAMMFVTFLEGGPSVYVSQPSYVATTDLGTKNLELYMNSGTYELPAIESGTPAYTVVVSVNDTL